VAAHYGGRAVQLSQTTSSDTSPFYANAANDGIMPSQLALGIPFFNATGERGLMGAVLEDAVACALLKRGPVVAGGTKGASDSWHHRLEAQWAAIAWMVSGDRKWPFSFLNCCDVLDIDPASLQAIVMAGLASAPANALAVRKQWHCRVKSGKGSRTSIVKPKVRSAEIRTRELAQYRERQLQRAVTRRNRMNPSAHDAARETVRGEQK